MVLSTEPVGRATADRARARTTVALEKNMLTSVSERECPEWKVGKLIYQEKKQRSCGIYKSEERPKTRKRVGAGQKVIRREVPSEVL